MMSVTHSMRHMFPNEFPVWPFQLLNNYRSPTAILLQLIFSFSQMLDDAKLPSLVKSIWMWWYLLLLGRFISVWQKLFVAQGYTATSFIYPNHLTSVEAKSPNDKIHEPSERRAMSNRTPSATFNTEFIYLFIYLLGKVKTLNISSVWWTLLKVNQINSTKIDVVFCLSRWLLSVHYEPLNSN